MHELVAQFARKSLNEKLAIFKKVLRQSDQTFSDLIKAWIHDTAGGDHGSVLERKVNQIVDFLWQDENGLLPLLEKTESFKERVTNSTAKVIRSELDVLRVKVKVFGRFDPTMNPEELDIQDVPGRIIS
jgi:hypothetical protein